MHKIMFHGWNKMMLVLEHLQEVEKQMICITKTLCRGRFKSLKIGFYVQRVSNDKMEQREKANLAFQLCETMHVFFDYFGITVD